MASTGFEYDYFAREAHVLVVDINPQEYEKGTLAIDSFINADVKDFMRKCLSTLSIQEGLFELWTK